MKKDDLSEALRLATVAYYAAASAYDAAVALREAYNVADEQVHKSLIGKREFAKAIVESSLEDLQTAQRAMRIAALRYDEDYLLSRIESGAATEMERAAYVAVIEELTGLRWDEGSAEEVVH